MTGFFEFFIISNFSREKYSLVISTSRDKLHRAFIQSIGESDIPLRLRLSRRWRRPRKSFAYAVSRSPLRPPPPRTLSDPSLSPSTVWDGKSDRGYVQMTYEVGKGQASSCSTAFKEVCSQTLSLRRHFNWRRHV